MKNGEHILTGYDVALSSLRQKVLKMGNLAYENLSPVFDSLSEGDLSQKEQIKERENQVDLLEKEVDEEGMSLIMRFQPTAIDLRIAFASINVAKNFERASDHISSIFKHICKILKIQGEESIVILDPIREKVGKALKKSIVAFADNDMQLAKAILEEDEEINEDYKKALKNLLGQEGGLSDEQLYLVFIFRSLERIGDLAKGVAEDIVFIESGEDIRHS